MKSTYIFSAIVALQFANQPCFAHHELEEHQTRHPNLSKSKDVEVDPWHLLDFAISPAYALSSNVRIYFDGNYRVVDSNGIPNHSTGQFPNAENPNTISAQSYQFRMPKDPVFSGSVTRLAMEPFGVAVNGIPFDPAANEFWNRDRNSGWQYEPMFHHSLGLDQSNAHVQPNGAYHYHGLPTGLLERLAQSPKPVLIGYAADGFPIYAPFGYREARNNKSAMSKLRSSYRLKNGSRPGGPGGRYDGTFVQDYEYVANAGDLDECNGRFGVTSEYPKGIYHYIVTDSFPFVPRMWKGFPDETFFRHGHTMGGGRRDGFGPGGGGGGNGERTGNGFRPGNGFPPEDGPFPRGGGPPGGGPPGGSGPPGGGGPPGGRGDEQHSGGVAPGGRRPPPRQPDDGGGDGNRDGRPPGPGPDGRPPGPTSDGRPHGPAPHGGDPGGDELEGRGPGGGASGAAQGGNTYNQHVKNYAVHSDPPYRPKKLPPDVAPSE